LPAFEKIFHKVIIKKINKAKLMIDGKREVFELFVPIVSC
jgi:hypothetical protein